MNKWGVRLIALLFIILAVSDVYGVITGARNGQSFTRFHINVLGIDFMPWVEIVILVYAGIQLLRFQPSGRYSALFIFGLAILASGIGLILIVVVLIDSLISGTSFPLTTNIRGNNWFSEPGGSVVYVVLLAVVLIIIYFIPAYFLMRKDVKQLFEKIITAEESTDIIQGEKS